MSGGSVVRDGVMQLRRFPSSDERVRVFRDGLAKLLRAFAPTELVLVRLAGRSGERPGLLALECAAAREEAARLGIVVSELGAHQVRRTHLPARSRQSNRALASHLAERFPSAWRGTLAATSTPEVEWRGDGPAPERLRTSRERYWITANIALGAAIIVLERREHERRLEGVICPSDRFHEPPRH